VHCVCSLTALIVQVQLFNLPASIFTVSSVKPQQKQQKRLEAVKAFWNRPETPRELRVAVLCLRLTTFCMNLVSQKRAGPAGVALTALASGHIQHRAGSLCAVLLQNINRDPALPAVPAMNALLTTLGHLLARFQQYQAYPTKLWCLSRRLNPTGWADACLTFLDTPELQLDTGYSLPLQREALRTGSEANAVSFLMSDRIQRELDLIFANAHGTSLDAERKIAHTKKNEKTKLISVGRASRNTILRQYGIARERVQVEERITAKSTRKHCKANAVAVALQRNPHLARNEASGPSGGHSGLVVDHVGLRQYVEQHRADLEKEATLLREKARQLKVAADCWRTLPHNNTEWLEWLAVHDADFRKALATAYLDRRALNMRLEPEGDLPACKRLLPIMGCLRVPWQDKLVCSLPGFFCIEHGGGKHVTFHVALHGQSLFLPVHGDGAVRELPINGSMSSAFLKLDEYHAKWLGKDMDDASVEDRSFGPKVRN
jgi:hypothetical protein